MGREENNFFFFFKNNRVYMLYIERVTGLTKDVITSKTKDSKHSIHTIVDCRFITLERIINAGVFYIAHRRDRL